LDKLARTKHHDSRIIVHPFYQLFPMRLELLWFSDVKQIHTPHNDFKHKVRDSMEKDGLLCPMVVDWNNEIRNGANRFDVIKKRKLADGSLFYKAKTPEEVNFLARLNVAVWEKHIAKENIFDFQFLFEGKMKKYTEKCLHLFTENVIKLK
jgi:hypothetical protein